MIQKKKKKCWISLNLKISTLQKKLLKGWKDKL